jgi:hypothetical protein
MIKLWYGTLNLRYESYFSLLDVRKSVTHFPWTYLENKGRSNLLQYDTCCSATGSMNVWCSMIHVVQLQEVWMYDAVWYVLFSYRKYECMMQYDMCCSVTGSMNVWCSMIRAVQLQEVWMYDAGDMCCSVTGSMNVWCSVICAVQLQEVWMYDAVWYVLLSYRKYECMKLSDCRLPPQSQWELRSSGLSRSE